MPALQFADTLRAGLAGTAHWRRLLRFSVPGSYRIRAIATDGAMFPTFDVDVKVNPGAVAENAR